MASQRRQQIRAPCSAACAGRLFHALVCDAVQERYSFLSYNTSLGMLLQAALQTFSKSSSYKRPAVWEQPDVLRQFQEHVLETTKNAFSLEDTKRRVAHNREYTSFMRKGRTAKQQADYTRDESGDNVNLGMHPYRSNAFYACYLVSWLACLPACLLACLLAP